MTTADERAARLEQAIRLKRAAARSGPPRLPRRPADEPALLGEMQRSLWLLHQMDPLSPAYNLASAFRVGAPLDAARLERALGRVVARHRLLRSAFRFRDGAVAQVVGEASAPDFRLIQTAAGEAMAAAAAAAREPFDLEGGPLVRLRLIEEPPGGDRLLVLALHHILADERSLDALWRELAEIYAGRPAGDPPAIQYDDYAHWAIEGEAESRRAALELWRRRLDPPPAELRLPFERPPAPAEGARRGRLLLRPAGPGALAGARRLAAAAGATPFAVFAFAFRLLLGRYTDDEPLAFATPASTRSHPATADMIGYFLNPVVVAAPIDEEQPVERAVSRFHRRLREALAHAAVPFDRLVEELAPPRRQGRHPLFQAMFVHRRSSPPPRLDGARLEPVVLDLGESKFDLTLFALEGEEELEIAVEYRTDRFAEGRMERLLGHYRTLLERLAEAPGAAVSELSVLDETERHALRVAAEGPEPAVAGFDLLPRRILDQASRTPDSPAVVCGGRRLSYAELAASSAAVSAALAAAGVRPGDRVGLFADRSTELVSGILGCHWAGAAYVPLDPAYPAARNRRVLEDAEVAAVLTTGAGHDELATGPEPVIDLSTLAAGSPERIDPSTLTGESVAYLLYTSGSSGRPKGVVVRHDGLRASTAARLQVYEATPPRRFLLLPSVAFDSSVAGIFWTLATGGALVVPTDDEAADPRRLSRLAGEERVTGLLAVPSLYGALLAAAAGGLEELEVAIVAGESCPPRLVGEHFRRLPGARLYNEYGPTEATVWASVHETSRADAARPVPIGRPIPGVRIEVLDRRGRQVPAGVPGEAWIAGPTVAAGYWRRDERTRERFFGGDGEPRRYRTGDRVAWRADGRLDFLGRVDEQIKLRGFRIEPGEIEAALGELAGVERAAVVVRGDDARLVGFVEGAEPEVDWRSRLAARLPEQMLPALLVTLPSLPTLPNGKIDRRELQETPLPASAPAARPALPPSDLEQSLISLWEGLLGATGIAPRDNFFELGGHSLLVFEMTLAIERDFEATLSPAEVFESPTVRQLAQRIERRAAPGAAPYDHLYPIQPGGRGAPLIFAVPHFFTAAFAARFRGERPVYGLRGVGLRQEGNLGRWRTMRQLGEELVREIERRFPNRPCILAGYSFGASMAVEAARQLEERGRPARRLLLIAPMPLDVLHLGPLRLQLDGLRRPIAELPLAQAIGGWARQNHPFTPRLYRRAWRRLAVEPWRRLLCLVGKARLRAGAPLTPAILWADVRVDRFRLHARYRPGEVRTPTVIFNAREPATDAAATWRPVFRGPLSVVETPDPHLDDASVDAAKRLILEQLAELEEEGC